MQNDFEQRYLELLERADIISSSPVKGCPVLKAYGYKIWEMIQKNVDTKLKTLGYENMYFPQFIPISLLKKQKEHHDSFIRETVRISHAGNTPLTEEHIVRPTSEAIIYASIKDWIKTEKDLPLRLNQWCSIVRWEVLKENFPLIRDNEFLWHECHSCHATEKECDAYVQKVFALQKNLIKEDLAIPVFEGKKPERRKFAGAEYTLALEAMMGNGKAVQIATSHSLAQRFSIPFDLRFTTTKGKQEYVWQACSGLTTRLIGALIMVHTDARGIILPPRIAPYEIAIIDDSALYDELKLQWRVAYGKTKAYWTERGVPLIIEKNDQKRHSTEYGLASRKKRYSEDT